jgi:hypothetical protein
MCKAKAVKSTSDRRAFIVYVRWPCRMTFAISNIGIMYLQSAMLFKGKVVIEDETGGFV